MDTISKEGRLLVIQSFHSGSGLSFKDLGDNEDVILELVYDDVMEFREQEETNQHEGKEGEKR